MKSAVEITRRWCYWHFLPSTRKQSLDFSSFNRPGF